VYSKKAESVTMIAFLGAILQFGALIAIGTGICVILAHAVVPRQPFPNHALQNQKFHHPRIIHKRTSPLQIKNMPHPTSLCFMNIPLEADFTRPNSIIQICLEGTIAPQSSGVLTIYVTFDGETIGLIPVTSILPLPSRDRWSLNFTLTVNFDGVLKCNGSQSFRNNQHWLQGVAKTKKYIDYGYHKIDVAAQWGNMINPQNELEVDSILVTSF
jgi:hypothetical protein